MKRLLLLALALALLTFAVYGRSAGNGFIDYDDPTYVTENPRVRAGLTADTLLWAFSSGTASNWHPLTWISHALDWELFGGAAAGHHLVSVGLHAANAVLLLFVMHGLTGAPWRSAAVAALFASHPLHVESVAWVAERKDVLCTFLGLVTVLLYLRHARRPGRTTILFVSAAFALGLMAKPMLVTLPFVLLLLDQGPLRRWNLLEKAPLFALAAASSIVTWSVQRAGGAVSTLDALPLGERLGNAAIAYVAYLQRTFWPVDLGVLYPLPLKVDMGQAALAALFLAALTAAAVALRRRAPYLLLGWLFYLGTLVPVIGLVQVGAQSSADRYTYIPLAGVFGMLVWGLGDLFGGRPRGRAVLAAAAALALAACAALTFRQVGFWRDSTTLFEHTLAVTRDNFVVHNNLGGVLMRAGRVEEAVGHFEASRRIRPGYAAALSNLGLACAAQGKNGEAIAFFREALKHRPGHLEAWLNLGDALQKDKDRPGAIAAIREALRLRPGDASITAILEALERPSSPPRPPPPPGAREQFARGNEMRAALRFAEAEAAYREAIRLDPRLDLAHNNLGILLALRGAAEEAAAEFRTVLRLNPRDVDAHLNLGVLLRKLGRNQDAAGHFAEALRLDPENAQAKQALGRRTE